MIKKDERAPCKHTRDIERLFVGDLPGKKLHRLYREIRECPACLRYFERCAEAEAALERVEAGAQRFTLTAEATARVAQRLELTPDSVTKSPTRAAWTGWGSKGWVLGLAAASACVVIAVGIPPAGDDGPQDTFQARGDGPLDPGHGLRVLAVRAGGHDDTPMAVEDVSGDSPLRPGDRIKVLYTELKGWRQLGVRIRWPDGRTDELRPYGPAARGMNRDAGPAVTVPEGMNAGPVEIMATFGRTAEVEAAFASAEMDGADRAVRVVRARVEPPSEHP